jgi:transcriptional regulator with XRE-family HTH domain
LGGFLAVRLRCYIRQGRGERSLRQIAELTDVSPGELSLIERGRLLPDDEQVAALELIYGMPMIDWYHPVGLLAIEADEDGEWS